MADKLYGEVVAGVTSLSIEVILRSTTDNSPVTAVTFGSVTAVYYRQGAAAPVAITMASLASANATWASGGWREIAAATYPGRYRLDVPDAAFAAGADWVGVQVRVAGVFNFDAHFNLQSASLIPDQVLKRDLSGVTGEATRSMLNALRLLRNRWVIASGTLSVKKEDDSTEAWNAVLTTTAGAAPITSTDPN